jgi:hypothetical protein
MFEPMFEEQYGDPIYEDLKMNPLDIHIKFPDKATGVRLMLEAGLLRQVDDLIVQSQDQMIDIIGSIYKPTGRILTDVQGLKFPEMTDVGGWHVNMRGDLPEIIKPYKITVTGTPHRIWD